MIQIRVAALMLTGKVREFKRLRDAAATLSSQLVREIDQGLRNYDPMNDGSYETPDRGDDVQVSVYVRSGSDASIAIRALRAMELGEMEKDSPVQL